MHATPPEELVKRLEQLELATADQVRRMGRRVWRLARDMPPFESVWVDALAQARILTHFQATQINAGRASALRVGPYLLCRRLDRPCFADGYLARHVASGQLVRLTVIERTGAAQAGMPERLRLLVAKSETLESPRLLPLHDAGSDGDRVWAASRWAPGQSAAAWMVHNGRFLPVAALEIARQMLGGLRELEKAGIVHGDLGAMGLILTRNGDVLIEAPGLRPIARPDEGFAHADLRPEAYDYLAPERVAEGNPADGAADRFAFGCVCWHLLSGRPPFTGGDAITTLRSAQAARVPDVREVAPDAEPGLAAAIWSCTEPDPSRRPESFQRLWESLGPPTQEGRRALLRCLRGPRRVARKRVRRTTPGTGDRGPSWTPAVAAALLVAIGGLLWSMFGRPTTGPVARIPADDAGQSVPMSTQPDGIAGSPANVQPPAGRGSGSIPGQPASAAAGPGESPSTALDHVQRPVSAERPADLVLPCDGPVKAESLDLMAGQTVRGETGGRPLVVVSAGGLLVVAEDVTFDGIDFVGDFAAATAGADEPARALIDVRVSQAEFRSCSFQSAGGNDSAPAAIRWTHPAGQRSDALSLPSGRLRLSNCLLAGVSAAIDCRTHGATAVEVNNTLHVGPGPLVLLDRAPAADEAVVLRMSRSTLRQSGPLLTCRFEGIAERPGSVAVDARACVFAPSQPAALVVFGGPDSPQQLLANVRWSGEQACSLVAPGVAIAVWQAPQKGPQVLDDASASIAGLVLSKVEFAGENLLDPAASRVTRWQVPLPTPDPPGIDPGPLRWPQGKAKSP